MGQRNLIVGRAPEPRPLPVGHLKSGQCEMLSGSTLADVGS